MILTLIKKKLLKEDQAKKLDAKIASELSEIEKAKDALNGLSSNQKFLLDLSPEEFRLEREKERQRKYESVKSEWIKLHKANPYLDYDIVYKDDEEIHEGVKMQFAYLSQLTGGAGSGGP